MWGEPHLSQDQQSPVLLHLPGILGKRHYPGIPNSFLIWSVEAFWKSGLGVKILRFKGSHCLWMLMRNNCLAHPWWKPSKNPWAEWLWIMSKKIRENLVSALPIICQRHKNLYTYFHPLSNPPPCSYLKYFTKGMFQGGAVTTRYVHNSDFSCVHCRALLAFIMT